MISPDSFINIHSHNTISTADTCVIRNIIVGTDADPDELSLQDGQLLSAGIHPWYIDEQNTSEQLNILRKLASIEPVKIIGECGLDRLRGPAPDLQISVFREHFALAMDLQKPLLIHCVRRFNELIEIKKELNPQIPLLIHGYNNKQQIADQLLKHGFFLSFGAVLLREGSNAGKVLMQTPADRLFLETGDKDISIERVYEAAASLRNISVNELKQITFANYLSLGI